SNADIFDPSFKGSLSEVRFNIIDIDNEEFFIIGTMQSNSIIGISRVFWCRKSLRAPKLPPASVPDRI
ncbi:hypothetical protein PIB30_105496, partial [Stylosanthes scabra]|nr:hypothetical protein [Stylosanthes scabra]